MYSPIQLSLKYLKYLVTASNAKGHGTHSPFVFDFITRILNDTSSHTAWKEIEKLRGELIKNKRFIVVEDPGAGSSKSKSGRRKIGDIARHSVKPKKYGQLLYRIADHYGSQTILELGSSLGLTTAYLASVPGTNLLTIEGAPALAELAEIHFDWLRLKNIQVVHGNFNEQLLPVLQRIPPPDLVFFDGNHRYEPTYRYFLQCLEYAREESLFIFDDIHWSYEMEQVWLEIKKHPSVTCTIDLFFLGIVFFRKAFHEKQSFTIRY